MPKLSIVIPVYNEEQGIAETVEEVLRVVQTLPAEVPRVSQVEFIVVNDGSRDRTAEIVRRYPAVRLISYEKNRGYGAALKTGFEAAQGDLLAFLDADMTYPPSSLAALCRELLAQDADIVLGSRFLGAESAMPFVRRVGNTAFAVLLSILTDRRITDTASGMRVFKKSALERLAPLPDGLDFTPAMSTRALHEEMKILEVPMPYRERVGRSKLSPFHDGVRFLRTIWDISKLYNPLRFYGAAGVFMLFLAALLGIKPVGHYLETRQVPDIFIYRLFTIQVLVVVGLNTLTFGAFANYVLAIWHNRPVAGAGLLARILTPPFIGRFRSIGLVLMVSAVLLNLKTIKEYVTTLHIYVHWVYILTGAVLFLTGAQLVLCSLLIEIISILHRQKGGRA